MKSTRVRLLSLLALAVMSGYAAVAPAHAQDGSPSLAITTLDSAAYPQMQVVVTALHGNGVPASGLTQQDFAAFEGDDALAIEGLSVQRLDLGVAIVIDVSGSMEGTPLAAAKAAAVEFALGLAPSDSASLFAFSNDVREVVAVTTDKGAVVAGINGLVAGGDTALFAATQSGVFAAASQQMPRKALVFLSDGQNASESPHTAEAALETARNAGVPIYAIGFGDAPDVAFLQALADASNGRYFAATPTSVSEAYAEISQLLDSQYTLTLAAEGGEPAGPSSVRVQAMIDGQPAEASAEFTRPQPPQPTPDDAAQVPTDGSGDDASGTGLVVLGGVAAVAILGLAAVGGATLYQRARTRGRQLAVVAPNPERASAQGVPMPEPGRVPNPDDGRGRLVSLDGVEGGPWEFGSRPLRIGTAPECEVRVPQGREAAPHHALIWMRDGKIMLRHTGGRARRTQVAGRPVEWIILESGDEFTSGDALFAAETLTPHRSI